VAYATCFTCGSFKKQPYIKCSDCGFNPKGDNTAMAKSIILSSKFWLEDQERAPTRDELQKIGEDIRNGKPYSFNEIQIQKVLEQKKQVEMPWSTRDKLQTISFFLQLSIVPILVAIYFLWMWFR